MSEAQFLFFNFRLLFSLLAKITTFEEGECKTNIVCTTNSSIRPCKGFASRVSGALIIPSNTALVPYWGAGKKAVTLHKA